METNKKESRSLKIKAMQTRLKDRDVRIRKRQKKKV